MAKLKPRQTFKDPMAGPVLSKRFLLSLLLMILGIGWIAYYYLSAGGGAGWKVPDAPKVIADLGLWSYAIGFVVLYVGMALAAHPATPLGRGRGVVTGMLGSFLIGLLWICVFYIFSNDLSPIWVFNDLGQWNLVVGIGFMAVGFAYATKWE